MRKIFAIPAVFFLAILLFGFGEKSAFAQTRYVYSPSPTPTLEPTPEPTVEPTPRPDLTQKTEESVGPLEELLDSQVLGNTWPFNPLKYAIRSSVAYGVPPNTIVLLLLLPLIAAVIAAARHILGLRGFGIFLPAALSVVFVAIGPVLGIGLFVVIVGTSTLVRFVIRKFKIKLQYLPRMAIMLTFVVMSVLGVLFSAPLLRQPDLANVSIFAILILALLSEDYSRVQLGKSAKVAINLTTETLVLSLISFIFLTLKPLQEFALLNPEILLLSVLVFDFALGKFVGLRLVEFWRFRKLISG